MSDLPDTDQPVTTTAAGEGQDDALNRAAESIREAREAEGAVAANDDITSRDDERAETHSEDPGVEDGS